jgi:DNA-binding MarR family transcriptional regulator
VGPKTRQILETRQLFHSNNIVIRYCLDDLTESHYQALGQFRYQIRKFLNFSEEAARGKSLEPHQHQMLLTIKALTTGDRPTIGQLAEHLYIKHHSAVGLLDRLEERALIQRVRATDGDRRHVSVRLTRQGEAKLRHLSKAHRDELLTSGPHLVQALQSLLEKNHESI